MYSSKSSNVIFLSLMMRWRPRWGGVRSPPSPFTPLLRLWWICLRLFEWSRRPNSCSSWKFPPHRSECYRSCAALTASIIHPPCPWSGTSTPGLEPSVAYKIQIPLNYRLLMDSTSPLPPPGNAALPQIWTSGGSIMLQLHLSPRHSQCRCASSRGRHSGAHQKRLTRR